MPTTAGVDPIGFDPTGFAVEEIARRYQPHVYRRALGLTHSRHDAEDLTQDVLVRLVQALPAHQHDGNFTGWVNRVTLNLFLDSIRRPRRITIQFFSRDEENRLPDGEPHPGLLVDALELDADIEQALAAMTPSYRAAVILRDLDGLSYKDIAAELNIHIGSVRTRIHRGRAQLRTALAHRSPELRHGIPLKAGPLLNPVRIHEAR